MENKIQNFIFQSLSQLNLPPGLNLSSSTIYSSPYQNLLLLLQDNTIIYQGTYLPSQNSQIFKFEQIPQSNNDTNKKYIICDFTQNTIYFITKEKNEVLISNYNYPLSLIPLKGILQKKKIKSVSCGKNASIFLTFGGMVYTNTDEEKDTQKLMNDLLEYNINKIYAGGYHYFCEGVKRNQTNDDLGNYIFSWGDNTYSQCGLNNNELTYIESPRNIFKNISVKNISLGNNHTMILTNNYEVIIFGDNQYLQCVNDESKSIVKLIENNNILPLIDVSYYTTPIDYLLKNDENIERIEAKNDSSLIITDKKSIILKGKIFGKEKIFVLKNDKNKMNEIQEDIVINDNLYCFGGDNYLLTITNDEFEDKYYEIKNNVDSNNTYAGNVKKIKLFNNNNNKDIIDENYESKTLNLKNDANDILLSHAKLKNINPAYTNKYKTISFQEDLSFEELKKDQNKYLNTASDISETSLSELRNYISLLGISFTSSYNDTNLSFRPNNLPKKSKEEENLHRKMVFQNRQLYFNLLKKKQEKEEANIKILEEKHHQQKLRAEFWNSKIIPNWSKMKNNKNIKKYFYEGIPNSTRGKVWGLCIGNKFSITKEYYDIEANKSIQLLIKLNKNKNKKINNNINNNNNNVNNYNSNNINKKDPNINSIESENSSSMSLATKKLYTKYIKQTLDKEKSINLIDLDIERTFSSLGVFKHESQLGNNLREILRIFVVARPDIGYVQGLSYIAGTLLLEMDKFASFVCFMNIILSPNILPFYRLDEINIKKRLDLFNEIFKLNLPKVYLHFQENEVFPEHYLLEWFMTLFTRNLNIELALRIWDIYMIEGIYVLYKTAIVIFSLDEKKILNMDFAEIMNFLKNLDKNNYDEDKFVEELNKVKLNDKIMNKIQQLNEEYLINE